VGERDYIDSVVILGPYLKMRHNAIITSSVIAYTFL